MTSVFVVHNPVAGMHDADDVRAALEDHFATQDGECEIYETTGRDQVEEVVFQALKRGFELVVATGGDGTVSSVAGGVAGTDIPLGIVPVGTGNSLARELGIPLDVGEALSVIRNEHRIARLDAMQIDERIALLGVGVGLSSRIMRSTERSAKRRFGRMAYIWAGLKEILGFQPRRFTIIVDGMKKDARAAEILVANSGNLGVHTLRWGQEIRLDDGCLDLCIVRARTALDYLEVAWYLLLFQARYSTHVRCIRVEHSVTIDAGQPLPVQADGDYIGKTPAHVQLISSAVQVIVPEWPSTHSRS